MKTSLYLAMSLLTRLPVPSLPHEPKDIEWGSSTLFYPLVGLLLGVLLYLPVFALPDAAPMLLASVVVVLWVIFTGALHLDGLADSADAWLGGMGSVEKTHRIMKDPLVGAAGVTAILCVFLLKFSALTVVAEQQLVWILVFAPCLGRVAILLVLLSTPYIRADGLGKDIALHLPKLRVIVCVVVCLLIAMLVSWIACLLFLLGLWALRRLMLQRLKGCTGDTLGASVELGEVFWLIGAALSV